MKEITRPPRRADHLDILWRATSIARLTAIGTTQYDYMALMEAGHSVRGGREGDATKEDR